MKLVGAARHFILAFILALAGYMIVFKIIEGRRTEKGPWQVAFVHPAGATPQITINQPSLAITNVQIVFTDGPTNAGPDAAVNLVFSEARPVPFEVPFGQCVMLDLRFLPGTLAFKFFGHEIELLPKALQVDRQEHPWQKDLVLNLHAWDKKSPP